MYTACFQNPQQLEGIGLLYLSINSLLGRVEGYNLT